MRFFSRTIHQAAALAVAGVILISQSVCRQSDTSNLVISRVSCKVGSGEKLWAKPDAFVDFSPGDELALLSLEFIAQSSSGSAWAEAYYYDENEGIVNMDGQFTYGKRLSAGENALSFKGGSWKLKATYGPFVVVLIHQFGPGDQEFRKVDTVNINLRAGAKK